MKEIIKALQFRFELKSQLLSYVNNIESSPDKWNSTERYARHLLIKKELESEVNQIRKEINNLYEKEKQSVAR